MDSECPECGIGPLYQDRHDQHRKVAHCDYCGVQVSEEVYLKAMEKTNNG